PVEFQAGVPVGPLPLGIWPAVERVLVDVFERRKFALGDGADLERGGHARLSTRPSAPPPTAFPARPAPLPVRVADLRGGQTAWHADDRARPRRIWGVSLTCAGVRQRGMRMTGRGRAAFGACR